MNDQDYIRKAVELADRWRIDGFGLTIQGQTALESDGRYTLMHLEQCEYLLDALAAQLREQAQSNPHIVFKISVVDSASFVEMLIYNPNGDEEAKPLRFVANETEEAMAFIKTIVDSETIYV